MPAKLVTECALCGEDGLQPVLSLGSSPPTCAMVPIGSRPATEEHHPLELLECPVCSLVQLSVIVDPQLVFPPEYPYSSGNSRALHEDFADLAEKAIKRAALRPEDLVVDIGANDGTLLSKFSCRTVGVEPTAQAERITGPACQEFFDEGTAAAIRAKHGPAKVITACNVLAHVDDLGEVMRGMQILLADDGMLVAENHDLASVVGGQWDTVYHEHLRFYSPYSFSRVLEKYGLHCWAWGPIPTHGGSFRMFASKRAAGISPPREDYDFARLAQDAAEARSTIRGALVGAPLYGIGATARATTIINYCGLDVEDVACVCEVPGSDKIGHCIPGTRIPVVDEARLFEDQADALLLSWHLADGIVPKLRERGYEGDILVPLPTLQTA